MIVEDRNYGSKNMWKTGDVSGVALRWSHKSSHSPPKGNTESLYIYAVLVTLQGIYNRGIELA